MVYLVIFDVDIKNNMTSFLHTDSYMQNVKTGQPCNYETFLEKFIINYVHKEEKADFYRYFNIHALKTASQSRKESISGDFRLLSENGEYRWAAITIMLPRGAERAVGTIMDFHEKKISELKLQHQVSHDSLTDLLNRQAFEREVFACTMLGGKKGAFCLIDVDEFKGINDTKGHAYGDKVLVSVAGILKNSIPENALAGRYGGDEFCLFIPWVSARSEIQPILEKILLNVQEHGEKSRGITVSIGVAFYPEHGEGEIYKLENCADVALYEVKKSGKNAFEIYSPQMGNF